MPVARSGFTYHPLFPCESRPDREFHGKIRCDAAKGDPAVAEQTQHKEPETRITVRKIQIEDGKPPPCVHD